MCCHRQGSSLDQRSSARKIPRCAEYRGYTKIVFHETNALADSNIDKRFALNQINCAKKHGDN